MRQARAESYHAALIVPDHGVVTARQAPQLSYFKGNVQPVRKRVITWVSKKHSTIRGSRMVGPTVEKDKEAV